MITLTFEIAFSAKFLLRIYGICTYFCLVFMRNKEDEGRQWINTVNNRVIVYTFSHLSISLIHSERFMFSLIGDKRKNKKITYN